MTLTLTPNTPASLTVTGVSPGSLTASQAAQAALSAQASVASTLAFARGGIYTATDYGAVGNGTTDDTTALQDWLNAADGNGVAYLPPGTYLTGDLNYRGQSIVGAGATRSVLKGKAGKDILVGDTTLSQYSRQHVLLCDFALTVDDSSDVSGSLSRGGAGNAALVFKLPDGAVSPLPMHPHLWSFERLLVQSSSATSKGRNASCGFYFQFPVNLTRMKDVFFYRLRYGYWDHFPTSNLGSVELSSDHNHWDSLYFNGCGDAMRVVNVADSSFTNLTFHSNTNAFNAAGAASLNRTTCFNLNVNSMMIEDTTTTPWSVVGEGHVVRSLNITGPHAGITVASSYSTFENCIIGAAANTDPLLTVSGSYNELRHLLKGGSPGTSARTLTQDNGTRNVIGWAPDQKPTITGSRGGNAALADLLTDLAAAGLITDSTTA